MVSCQFAGTELHARPGFLDYRQSQLKFCGN
jgi:hypothetical protein